MFFLPKNLNIDFMRWRKITSILSVILIVGSIATLATKQLNWGLDFTGGTLIEVGYPKAADLNAIRDHLAKNEFSDAVVIHFGTSKDVVIRLQPREGISNEQVGDKIIALLQEQTQGVTMRRIEFVGPQVGDELAQDGSLAMLVALMCIMLYVTMRFEWRFSLGAVAALAHDVTIILGFFSLFQVEFDLVVLAAVLAIIGYSLNDTIVVCDRIRENFRKLRKGSPLEVVNISLNQTLSRTLVTSLTTLLVVVVLFLFGGQVIHSFAEALIIGILIGTYSSIYVASSVALALGVTKEDLIPVQVEKEGADQEGMI